MMKLLSIILGVILIAGCSKNPVTSTLPPTQESPTIEDIVRPVLEQRVDSLTPNYTQAMGYGIGVSIYSQDWQPNYILKVQGELTHFEGLEVHHFWTINVYSNGHGEDIGIPIDSIRIVTFL